MQLSGEESAKLVRVLRAGDVVLKNLIDEFDRSELFLPPLSYRGRVKKEKGAANKISRKRSKKPDYSVASLTDIVGIRFITMLRQDIASVIETLFRMMTLRNFEGREGSLCKARPHEYIQYVALTSGFSGDSAAVNDPLKDRLQELLGSYFTAGQLVFKREVRQQYSSVHFVVWLDVPVDGAHIAVPIEFQIRSVFEEAWGEIDHMLFYEADREGDLAGEQERLAASRHLAILKNLLDTAGEYAALISEGNFGAPKDKATNINENLDGIDHMLQISNPITIHKDIINAFADLIRLKEAVDKDEKKSSTKLASYASLADRFLELLNRFHANVSSAEMAGKGGERLRATLFLLQMEEALARMLSASPQQVQKALQNYRQITAEFEDRPTAWFRLAQAAMHLLESATTVEQIRDHREESTAAFDKCRKLLNATPASKELIITPGQRAYLHNNIERLQGFAYWRSVDLERSLARTVGEEGLALLQKAYDVAEKALPSVTPDSLARLNLLNSACYFQFEVRDVRRQLGKPVADNPAFAVMVAELDKSAREIRQRSNEPEERFQQRKLNIWHTVLKGYLEMDDRDGARRAANAVCAAHASSSVVDASEYDREMGQRAFQDAWRVIATPDR